jgi:hypothetical protein
MARDHFPLSPQAGEVSGMMRSPLQVKAIMGCARLIVMAGHDPAIHVFLTVCAAKTWMPGTRPGMTNSREGAPRRNQSSFSR